MNATRAANSADGTVRPLADRMRPQCLADVVGQSHAVGPGTLIRHAIETDRIFSMLIWGPPGCGKTTLARIIAAESASYFVQISAVLSGVKEIRAVVSEAREQQRQNRRTILFVDEIHRFNKSQQDAFLQHVENGLITLIGATTENPSFEVIPALMSRCRVIVLEALTPEEIERIIDRCLSAGKRNWGRDDIQLETAAKSHLVRLAQGDARIALNHLETVVSIALAAAASNSVGNIHPIDLDTLQQALQQKALLYDKNGEEHYNLISALHKSLRGSDPDGALYWMARMLTAGEDPLYIGRRMVRFASEDIGNADPNALTVALNAVEAFRFLGHPEGDLCLAQAALYLATAPKSNRTYTAYGKVLEAVNKGGSLPVPLHIRNAPTRLMKQLGYGRGYKYAHDYRAAVVHQTYLPKVLKNQRFYYPASRGYEKTIKHRLDGWREMLRRRHDGGAPDQTVVKKRPGTENVG